MLTAAANEGVFDFGEVIEVVQVQRLRPNVQGPMSNTKALKYEILDPSVSFDFGL